MQSLLKNKPKLKNNHIPCSIIIVVLSLISISLLLMPVVVNFLNKFSTTESTSEIIYYICRGLFGLAFATGVSIFVVKKDVAATAIPCLIGFITVMFPLYENVSKLTNAYTMAQQLSINISYGPYLVDVGITLLYALLCLFTLLYSIGLFKYVLIIMLLSVIGSLATVFICIHKYITYDISVYDVLSFGYASIACLIPLVLVLYTTPQSKSERYKARRMS